MFIKINYVYNPRLVIQDQVINTDLLLIIVFHCMSYKNYSPLEGYKTDVLTITYW